MAAKDVNYREQALKMFPWVCARCAREFSGKQLRMLTVHHKDHNHDHNPADGSNWELLCVYCHDNEHQRYLEADARQDVSRDEHVLATSHPFAGLAALLKERE
ncbi:HNH nuclease family protein [Mariprofundus erugo]|uniref:Putative HNH nuclease YajD n=1 Tax=Mariprofundus erugo TaxID=2528639 RepID=A0A5R9GL77_9PROT|nr:YajD family HNH nuclease [Mariprofundus erugo]TLS66478.1 HNH nuclease family protein [Mariprofundus erugo]TLS77877.1 HNH nuclease family protein [Mariprofundus erugo]